MKKKLRKLATIQSKRIRGDAKFFAKWLDLPGKLQSMFRPLLELAAAAQKHELRRKRLTDALDPSDPFFSYEKKINRILRSIEERYPSQLSLSDWGHRDRLLLFARQSIRQEEDATQACLMLHTFERLANVGAFAALALCALPSCGKRVFALRLNKKYCSDACQRTHYNQSSERKKANKRYQKKHYREYLSKEAKRMQKLAARRGLRGHLSVSAIKRRLREAGK
jgi:hypothetical protein